MTKQGIDFSGTWYCTYWFPSNEHVGDDSSTYVVSYQAGTNGEVVFESEPKEDGSYILVRLKIEDGVAIGTWHESTSPFKSFKGAHYSGSGQLIVDQETGNMVGKWAGAGFDHRLKTMRVYAGNWEILRKEK